MLRKLFSSVAKFPKGYGLQLSYNFSYKPRNSRPKNFSSSRRKNRQARKLEPKSFENFRRRPIPKKPIFLQEGLRNKLEASDNNYAQLESDAETEEKFVEYKFDEDLGMIVPV